LLFEPMECGIERPLRNLQGILADLLDPLRNRPPVLRFEGDGLQDQEIQRSLDQIRRLAHGGDT